MTLMTRRVASKGGAVSSSNSYLLAVNLMRATSRSSWLFASPPPVEARPPSCSSPDGMAIASAMAPRSRALPLAGAVARWASAASRCCSKDGACEDAASLALHCGSTRQAFSAPHLLCYRMACAGTLCC